MSLRRFYQQVYEEHLEEASFLFEQRMYLIHDVELSWRDHEDFEARFQRHLEGLLSGGEPALKVCVTQGIEGDFGEFHCALRVLLIRDQYERICQVLDERPFLDEPEHQHAVWSAFALAHPSARQLTLRFLNEAVERWPDLVPAAIHLIGWLRLNDQAAFLEDLQYSEQDYGEPLLQAMVRLAEPSSVPALEDFCFRSEDESMRHWAALGLVRQGHRKLAHECLRQEQVPAWSFLPLSIAHHDGLATRLLQEYQNEGVAHGDGLLALGFLGDARAVPLLIDCLRQEIFPSEAAQALNLITGADLYEEIFEQEQVDEDELFEEELEAYHNGEPARKADGSLAGEYIVRLAETEATWTTWWQENSAPFHPGTWYRRGKPGHPSECVAALLAETHSNKVRWWLGQELFARFNIDISLELEMPIQYQIAALHKVAHWAAENSEAFLAGNWYLKGFQLNSA